MLSAEATIPPAGVRSLSRGRTRSSHLHPFRTAEHVTANPFQLRTSAESSRTVVAIFGELDIAAADTFRAGIETAGRRGLPIVVDCRSLTFIDAFGIRLIVESATARRTRLTNVPANIARTFALVGLDEFLASQQRRTIAVAVCEEMNPIETGRVGEIFLGANDEGCTYELIPASHRDPRLTGRAAERFHAVVIPPLTRWMGISTDSSHARWMRLLVDSADHVIAIGTGAFLIAAAGRLDGHDVVAGTEYADELAAVAPTARVHRSVAALRDGAICTAIAAQSALSICTSLVGDDYGVDVQHRLTSRLAGTSAMGPSR